MVSLLTKKDKEEIVEAIGRAENLTSGEIRVHLKKKCGEDVLAEAKKVFSKLRMHKTKERNAVLILIALHSKKFAILGDSGIHRHVGEDFWAQTRDTMASHFLEGRMKEGIVAGVMSAGEKLKAHFPLKADDKNELSNTITED